MSPDTQKDTEELNLMWLDAHYGHIRKPSRQIAAIYLAEHHPDATPDALREVLDAMPDIFNLEKAAHVEPGRLQKNGRNLLDEANGVSGVVMKPVDPALKDMSAVDLLQLANGENK